jgi:hypothetical protein
VFFAKVFNAEQIDGMPPIDHIKNKLEEWERHEKAERILKASGVEIIHKPSDTPYYSRYKIILYYLNGGNLKRLIITMRPLYMNSAMQQAMNRA